MNTRPAYLETAHRVLRESDHFLLIEAGDESGCYTLIRKEDSCQLDDWFCGTPGSLWCQNLMALSRSRFEAACLAEYLIA